MIILYIPFTSDEYHAWFHVYGLSRAARNAKQAKISKWKILVHEGIRIHDPLFAKPPAYQYD